MMFRITMDYQVN